MKLLITCILFFLFSSCFLENNGDDCMGGACCCSNQIVDTIEPTDSNYFPDKIRQQIIFASKTDSTIFQCYTIGINKNAKLVKVGTKAEQVRCGTDYCDFLVNNIPQNIIYNTLGKNEILKIGRQTEIILKYTYSYSYDYAVSEYSFINILGSQFYFKSNSFNINDSNNVTFNQSLNIENNLFSEVFVLEKDTLKLPSFQPFKCYYSKKNDGLIGFELKNGSKFFRVN
ncbi:MAG: hypothetical protein ACOYMA_13945 [Bacteroidia bacterium]